MAHPKGKTFSTKKGKMPKGKLSVTVMPSVPSNPKAQPAR